MSEIAIELHDAHVREWQRATGRYAADADNSTDPEGDAEREAIQADDPNHARAGAAKFVRHGPRKNGNDRAGDAGLPAPPHSDNAEQSVLGGLLLENAAVDRIADLRAEDFYSETHRILFEAIVTLIVDNKPADVITVAEVLTSAKKLDYVGGMAYLGALIENVPTAANVRHYAQIVRRCSLQRKLAAAANEIRARAIDPNGESVLALLDDARERIDALALASPGRLHFATFDEVLRLGSPQWRIVKIIPSRGVIVIYGASGSGKTFLAFDIGAAIARGAEWFGHRVKRGAVVYLAAEGHLRHRAKAYATHYPDADLSLLRVLHAPLELRSPDGDLRPLLSELRALGAQLRGIAAVVIDTLNAVMGAGAENLPEDMGAILGSARKIVDELGCVVIIIHHTGKDRMNGPRGHSSLAAAVETQILVTEDNGLRTAEIEKQRDGEKGEQFCFRLLTHTWPSEDPDAGDGEDDGSCVVVPELGATGRLPAGAKPASRRDVALDSLREAISEHGEVLPGSSVIPPSTKAVRIEKWERRWLLRTGNDYGKPETARAAFRRERLKLLKDDVVVVADPFAWIP
ncbi:MAG TPA: AAA family ATPase [Casimicrobiaceae bacterium]|nr:AAA family ATPase [Casimicrobiaceae bacterium]